jgi:CheY-like chemotaxis protein
MQAEPYVLIVDDEPAVRNIIADIVMDEGMEAAQATDGLEALWFLERARLLRRRLPAVVTLDMMMPRMNGLTFLHEAKQAGFETIPVILCSATLRVREVQPDPQIFAHLTKPFDLDDLLHSIQQAVHLSAEQTIRQESQASLHGWIYHEVSRRWVLQLADLKAVIVEYPDLPHPRRYLAYILTARQSFITTVASADEARDWVERQILRLNKS